MMDVERELMVILGGSYGGPSLSFEGGRFIIYGWGDAPVGIEDLARGNTLEAVIREYKKEMKRRTK